MSQRQKFWEQVLSGARDGNVPFAALRTLLLALGFAERVRGSHHIYSKSDVVEILNLQPQSGGKAKPYQVKQVRALILRYGFTLSSIE